MTKDNTSDFIMDESFKVDDLVDAMIEDTFDHRKYTNQICFNTQVIHRNIDDSIIGALNDDIHFMLHSD